MDADQDRTFASPIIDPRKSAESAKIRVPFFSQQRWGERQYRSRMSASLPAHPALQIRLLPTLHVHFLPAHVPAEELAGSVVIVIDLLRASSTICQALASGATCVMPFLEIDDARRAAAEY